MESGLTTDDALSQYIEWYESSEMTTREARELSERCWDYYDGKQLTDQELQTLRARRQPPVVKNWIKREIDTLIGLEKSQRTDPRAYPRTPQHEQGAEAATDSLRYVVENEEYDQKRSRAWFDMIVKGYGGLQLVFRPNGQTGELDIGIECTPWDRMWFDPHSTRPDFDDARYLGLVVWHDMDVAEHIYRDNPEALSALEAARMSTGYDETYEDKPRFNWYDAKRKRVRVVQMYHQTPQGWMLCEFTKGGKLREGESPFKGENGPTHPFIWRSAYIDRDNNRYGLVKEMLDIQDEINKRSSKLLHLANVRQTWSNPGVIQDIADFRKKAAQPDAHLRAEGGVFGQDWGFVENPQDVMGHAQLLQEAKNEMNLAGPNPSLSGEAQSARSGRALQTEQQASLMQLGGLLNALRDMDRRIYRKVWNQIRAYWTAPKWVRVTDDERNIRFVGLNQPQQDPNTGQIMIDPRTGQPALENPVEQLDVDIIIEDAPDQVSLQGETFANLVDLARVGVPIPPQVFIQAAPGLRNKQQLLDTLEQAGQNPQAQQLAALEMAEKQADIQYTQARTIKERAQAQENAADAAQTIAEMQARSMA